MLQREVHQIESAVIGGSTEMNNKPIVIKAELTRVFWRNFMIPSPRSIIAIWKKRRVWQAMIDLWEAECIRKGGVVLQPGETIRVEMPITKKDV
jgi:hypothetical protein